MYFSKIEVLFLTFYLSYGIKGACDQEKITDPGKFTKNDQKLVTQMQSHLSQYEYFL